MENTMVCFIIKLENSDENVNKTVIHPNIILHFLIITI